MGFDCINSRSLPFYILYTVMVLAVRICKCKELYTCISGARCSPCQFKVRQILPYIMTNTTMMM